MTNSSHYVATFKHHCKYPDYRILYSRMLTTAQDCFTFHINLCLSASIAALLVTSVCASVYAFNALSFSLTHWDLL